MKFNILSEFRVSEFSKYDEEEFKKLVSIVTDEDYLNFLQKTNGGSILNNAMNFYGLLPHNLNLEIFYNNYLFKKYFGKLFLDTFVFAEDVFGDQFGFQKNGPVVFFSLETAEIRETFKNFNDFVEKTSVSVDYYSGFSMAEKWIQEHGKFQPDQRLVPIKPFVIGGAYDIKNFHLLQKEKFLDYTSNIAKQIKDLPDGTDITLRVT